MRETYLRSIDVIYIDPPYNTGNNLIYRNNYYQDAEDYLISSEQLDDYGNHMVYNLLTMVDTILIGSICFIHV